MRSLCRWWWTTALLVTLATTRCGHSVSVYASFNQPDSVDEQQRELRAFIGALLVAASNLDENERCFVIITDDLHRSLYDRAFFRDASVLPRTYYVLRVSNANEQSLRQLFGVVATTWHQLRMRQCSLHFITIANGLETKRLLRFAYRERALNVHGRFVLLHDTRLLEHDMWPVWCNMLSAIFLQRTADRQVHVMGIPFPNILNGIVVTQTLQHWRSGGRLQLKRLFPASWDERNLQGLHLPVAVNSERVPMVMRGVVDDHVGMDMANAHFIGVEVEIMRVLGVVLNFRPVFYTPPMKRTNSTYTPVLEELLNYKAVFAIGDLHPYEMHRNKIDFSWPHSSECLTFLTPESSRDDSWRTLLQPFSIGMWACVLLSLTLVGTIFYVISFLNSRAQQHRHPHHTLTDNRQYFSFLRRQHTPPTLRLSNARRIHWRMFLMHRRRGALMAQQHSRADMFDSYSNCILLTYSMLLYVALPGMPRHWPLRVLTGWFWIYCILVTVTYRASLTAILANPAARITIDTLAELQRSHLTTTVGSIEDKQIFDDAGDEAARAVGQRLEIIDIMYGVTERIALENVAYYDSTYYLRQLRLDDNKQRDGDEVLHIMHDCVVQMPVAIGMQKNSMLKMRVDTLLQRLSNSGLLDKWLRDVTQTLDGVERTPPEAVMNLNKIWSSFVALAIGLLVAVLAIVLERLHYRLVVCKHPLYDEYNRNLYYNFRQFRV